ncbi:MAG: hypothetical protein ACE14S_04250 [Candidatus Bathyarchaeia archaeon]
MSAAPNPVGVGQDIVLIWWLNIPPPTAAGNTGDRWQNVEMTITKPDGTSTKRTGLMSDPVGSGYQLYSPDVVGQYKVDLNFPGQVLKQANPVNGRLGSDSVYINDTYLPSSTSTTFTVQANPVTFFEEAPFPRSYWTRPINENNQQWTAIASNWLGQQEYGATYMKFQPYGWAPSTAHVIWTYPLSWGGMVGGDNAISDTMSFYSGTQYQLKFSNPIIMYGNVYFSLPLNNAPTGNGLACVDLRTGETKWINKDIASVTIGQLYDFEGPNQHGTTGIYLWSIGAFGANIFGRGLVNPGAAVEPILKGTYAPGTQSLGAIASTTNNTVAVSAAGWSAIDPQTGRVLFNLTGIPSGTRAYGPQGEWLMYNIGRPATAAAGSDVPFTYLWQWNNTKLPGNDAAGGITQWIPGYSNYNMSASYDWNVTLSQPLYPTKTTIGSPPGGFSGSAAYDPATGLYTNLPRVMRIFPGNLIFGESSGLQRSAETSYGVFGTPTEYEIWAINLNASRAPIGTVLFDKKYPAPPGNLTVMVGPASGDDMVYTIYFRETMQWSGYSLLDGSFLWGPTPEENAWNFYGGTTGLTNPYAVGYGHLYSAGHGGTLYAYNLKTGKIDFTYGNDPNDPKNSTITTATAYGAYPTQVAAVANNKVYLVEEEHSLNAPAYHGAATRCVDAFTGKELWKVYGISSWQMQAVADGYYTWLNLNDMQIYCIGPGPSSTSVTAAPAVVSKGGSVEITGTVLDQSPNPKLKGTACIADADQGPWMEYMVQSSRAQPYVNGIPVQLTAIDKAGVAHDLGTVTSDSTGLFHKLWAPPAEGEYVIYANFAGTDSYGPSTASCAIGVTSAPAASPTPPPVTSPPPTTPPTTSTPTPTQSVSPSLPPPPEQPPPTEMYIIVAVVVVIIVVAAALAVVLRRRK